MASAVRSTLLRQTAAGARSMAPSVRAGPSPSIAQTAAFHASSRRNLLPPGPQVIHGTVNDPAPIPPASPSHGHYHWTFERGMAAALVPLTIAPFAAGSLNPTLDAILCSTVLIHSHMGVQAIIIDYVPKTRFPTSRKACHWLLNAATILAGIGLYEFETTDVGVVEATKRLWRA
ncbi:Succinate dehydrogenase [ubiquinone] cytochrome b small subunit, mitochondrial [Cytospora mali]|uniref:Succinate dehydrogenase [ubiquinone] cytochrome b small subunit n=1 Tax=Cytospora mali TaxID=578113 RepID=A0A194V3B1_CYTMA|nr:Succinate dehydrogenase [ubiquinone] cytochrome b small subunit, mitochondrial [Valsa mali var. pyri (nom. inval.)]